MSTSAGSKTSCPVFRPSARHDPIRDVLKKLVDEGNLVGLIGCGDENRIASGEFVGLALMCSGNNIVRAKRKGAR